MAKRILLILCVLLLSVLFTSEVKASDGESYPAPGIGTIATASIGIADTTVTPNKTGYLIVWADTDVRFNFDGAATDTHPKLASGTMTNMFPIRMNKASSSRTPTTIHFKADSTTGNIQYLIIEQ